MGHPGHDRHVIGGDRPTVLDYRRGERHEHGSGRTVPLHRRPAHGLGGDGEPDGHEEQRAPPVVRPDVA
jgi:hypothetical protein